MTPTEFRRHLRRLSLTQNGMGRMLAVDDRRVRRWAAGSKPVPEAVAGVLSCLEPAEAHALLAQSRRVR